MASSASCRSKRPRRGPTRLTTRRWRSSATNTSPHSPCHPSLQGSGEAPVHVHRCTSRRSRHRWADPRHLQPDRRPHRQAFLRCAKPSQHPDPDRRRPPITPGLRPSRGHAPAGGRLQPDRAASHRHLAEDPGLIEAFSTGADIHRNTAARIFGVEPSEVTIGMRSKAKMVSYGLAYGMESYGLAQRLGIGVEEAAQILKAYFENFPRVRSYMDAVVVAARDKGYTETLFGRRRLMNPELSSPSIPGARMAGEQPTAMNAGIQGLAADIFKVALVRLDAMLGEESLRSRLILQVHDEVLLGGASRGGRSSGEA